MLGPTQKRIAEIAQTLKCEGIEFSQKGVEEIYYLDNRVIVLVYETRETEEAYAMCDVLVDAYVIH